MFVPQFILTFIPNRLASASTYARKHKHIDTLDRFFDHRKFWIPELTYVFAKTKTEIYI